MPADVFTHPWLGGLFGDDRIAELLSAEASLANMLRVEAAFARAQGTAGAIDKDLAEAAASGIAACEITPKELRTGTARDGVPVPALVQLLKARLPETLHPAIHAGLTSQDVVDTALVLALVPALAELQSRLSAMIEALEALDHQFGARRLMGRTRMQAALPIGAAGLSRLLAYGPRRYRRACRLAVARFGNAGKDRPGYRLDGPAGDR